MKREFLKGILPDLADAALDAIMAEHGKDIEAQKNAAVQLTTERDALRTSLDTATREIQSYKDMDIDGVKSKAAEWEKKHAEDTQALRDQLGAATYGYAVQTVASALKFSSEAAKRAFAADLTAKKLPLQDDKLLGLEDYVKAYKEADADAFASDDDKTPVATRGTGGGAPIAADAALRAALGLPENKK